MADKPQPKIPSITRKLIRDLRKMAEEGDDVAERMTNDLEASYQAAHPWAGWLEELTWVADHGEEEDRSLASFLLERISQPTTPPVHKGSARNVTREKFARWYQELSERNLVIDDHEEGAVWAQSLADQVDKKGCAEPEAHEQDAKSVQLALGRQRKAWSDNPYDDRLKLHELIQKISDKKARLFPAASNFAQPEAKIGATTWAALESAEIGRALGKMEQILGRSNLLYFNTGTEAKYLEAQHRHVLQWVTPYPLPDRLHPSMICLGMGETKWVKLQQARYIIGVKVPSPGVLGKLLANNDEFRKKTIPKVVAHNRMLSYYGGMLKEINLLARLFLSTDPEDDMVRHVVEKLQDLHVLIQEARGRI
ncbi:MAG: hypothetical protein RLY93_16375 [Sumerlaeia bacterium]